MIVRVTHYLGRCARCGCRARIVAFVDRAAHCDACLRAVDR